jgi:molybdenum cofactor cytidylyltransferase
MAEVPFPVAGVVLAAGRSRRMGESKALLDAGGSPFVARAVTCLFDGGARPVVVVVRPLADDVASAAVDAGAVVAVNPAPDDPERGGPLSSLRTGLEALPADIAGLVLLPVDHPRVTPGTVRALIGAFRRTGAPVTVPSWRGRRGHPVLLSATLFPELLADPLPEGVRTVVRRHAGARCEVPVEDPGVLDDLDTPEAYRAAFPGEESF